eukprot:gene876-4146_t
MKISVDLNTSQQKAETRKILEMVSLSLSLRESFRQEIGRRHATQYCNIGLVQSPAQSKALVMEHLGVETDTIRLKLWPIVCLVRE